MIRNKLHLDISVLLAAFVHIPSPLRSALHKAECEELARLGSDLPPVRIDSFRQGSPVVSPERTLYRTHVADLLMRKHPFPYLRHLASPCAITRPWLARYDEPCYGCRSCFIS